MHFGGGTLENAIRKKMIYRRLKTNRINETRILGKLHQKNLYSDHQCCDILREDNQSLAANCTSRCTSEAGVAGYMWHACKYGLRVLYSLEGYFTLVSLLCCLCMCTFPLSWSGSHAECEKFKKTPKLTALLLIEFSGSALAI